MVLAPLAVLAAVPPMVFTHEPTTITADAVILEAKVTNTGGDDNLNVWFNYGESTALGKRSATKSFTGRGVFSIRITGLEQCTKYYYRPSAENQAGIAYGQTADFTTYCPPPETSGQQATSPPATAVGTGLGADIFKSILLPLFLAGLIVWLFKSKIIALDQFLAKRKAEITNLRAKKKLAKLTKR